MQTYLVMFEKVIIENGLFSSVIFAGAGLFIISILLCFLIRARYRNRLVNLDTELKKECVNHEEDRRQLSDNLNAAHEKIQQQEEQLTTQSSRIELIENDKQAAEAVAERATILEGQRNQYLLELLDKLEKECGLETDAQVASDAASEGALWQRHGTVITALTNRLHTEERRCAELEQILQHGQTMLAEKEAALEALRHTVNEQAGHIAKTEQDFVEQMKHAGVALSKLQAKYQSYNRYFGSLAFGRMQVFNDLNILAHKIHQLETDIKTEEAHVELITLQENQDEEQPVIEEQSIVASIPEKSKPSNPLFARFVNAVKTDFGLAQQASTQDEAGDEMESQHNDQQAEPQQAGQEYITQLAEKDAVIDELTAGFEARKRHISRLEDTLEAEKQVPSAAVSSELEAGQVSGQERVAEEREEAFDTKPTAIGKAAEKAAQFPQGLKDQWLGLFKKQTHDTGENERPSPDQPIEQIDPLQASTDDEATPKAGNIPGQLKDLYQKMTSFTR